MASGEEATDRGTKKRRPAASCSGDNRGISAHLLFPFCLAMSFSKLFMPFIAAVRELDSISKKLMQIKKKEEQEFNGPLSSSLPQRMTTIE